MVKPRLSRGLSNCLTHSLAPTLIQLYCPMSPPCRFRPHNPSCISGHLISRRSLRGHTVRAEREARWGQTGSARSGIPEGQAAQPNPKTAVLHSTPKLTSSHPRRPPRAPPALTSVRPDRQGCISGTSVQDVTVPGDGPGQEVRISFLPGPGGLSDGQARSLGAKHKIESGFSLHPAV